MVAQAPRTTTPIEHLIVVVGENLSFDNLFGTYRPNSGAAVHNLLSEGIVNPDGSPGPNFVKAAQRRAEVHDLYEIIPRIGGTYGMLPQPGTTHAVGVPRNVPDQRFPELLPNGPFPITKHIGYEEPIGDPVRRFFRRGSKSMAGGAIFLSGSPGPRARAHRALPIRFPALTEARSRWASAT